MAIYQQTLDESIRRISGCHMITYEQPLNEKIRLLLRLELLMGRFRYHIANPMPEDTVVALQLLLDLYNLSARVDVKSEILKELDRVGQSMRLLLRQDQDEANKLDTLLEKLNYHSDILYQQRGQLGQHLKNHVFFNSLRQRSSLPGGINGFDIPLFQYWQEQPVENRLADLREWAAPYIHADDAAHDILGMIRDLGESREAVAKEGFFQCTLEGRKASHMLRVSLVGNVDYYPEISAGKQRFTLRFVNADMMADRGKQFSQDVPFTLTLCNL
ncbi:MAG: cell division protein ZapD [Pseudomonadota bacterium]